MKYRELYLENRFLYPVDFEYIFAKWFYSTLVLSFNMQSQTQSRWCWAATSTSVSRFYSILSPWTQCKVASAELTETCCNTPVPSACNISWYLNKALARTNNFVSFQGGTISYERIRQELKKGLVVGARIGWNGGGGHFMIIHGVTKSLGIEYLHIDDPIYGKNTMTYNQFASNYQNSGTWTHTYFTKKHYYFMWLNDLILNPILFEPIPKVRPMLKVYGEKIDESNTYTDNNLGVPHYVYNIDLSDIKKGMKLPKEPVNIRVLDTVNEMPIAFYDVSLNEEKPELLQMNSNKDYFELLNHSIGRLRKADSKNKSKGELRLIRVPSLNLEAAWLNYSDRTKDIISVLPRFDYHHIKNNTEYTPDEFLQLLVKEKNQLGEFDDLLGG